MNAELFSLFLYVILFPYVMLHCTNKEASMQSKQLCVLTTASSKPIFGDSKIQLRPPPPVVSSAVRSKAMVLLC